MVLRGRKLVAVVLAGPRWPGPWLVADPGRRHRRARRPPSKPRRRRARAPRTPPRSTARPSPPPTRGRSTTPRPRPQSKQTMLESGDAGPASGSQTVIMGTGSISIIVIGGITYVKGNVGGLETLVGLSASQASRDRGPVDRVLHHQRSVRSGRRRRALERHRAGAGVEGAALARASAHDRRDGGRRDRGDAEVRAHDEPRRPLRPRHGSHVPVEEDSVNAKGQHTAAEHIAYSKWGEIVRPRHRRPPSPSDRSARSDPAPSSGPRSCDPDPAARTMRGAGRGTMGRSPPGSSERTTRHRAGPSGE